MPLDFFKSASPARSLRRHAALLLVLTLAGCVTTSVIRNPPAVSGGNPSTVPNPVLVQLDWSGVKDHTGTPTVAMDGADVTANFNMGGCCQAQASFTLPAGQHTVSVTVRRNSSLSQYYNEALPFNVVAASFTLSANPASVALRPGTSAPVVVTATGMSGFTGTVTPGTVTGLPTGVTATTTSTGALTYRIDLAASATATSASTTATTNASGTGGLSAATTFTVAVQAPGFTITGATPSTLLVPRGGSAALPVTVQRTNGLTDPITITATGLSGGITAPATTIAAGSNSGTITFTAANDAGLAAVATGNAPASQSATVTLTGICPAGCPGAVNSKMVTIRIGRRTGQFVVTPPSLRNAPSQATSADNASTLAYAVANPQPPGATQFTATFRRTASTNAMAAINLAQSPIDFGAGFCTASPTIAGVVLSSTYGGQTSAPVFYMLPIWALAPSTAQARQIMVPMYPTMTGANASVTPTLWYSPDCTMAAHLDATGVPATPSSLSLLDMTTGQRFGSEQPFSGAAPSKIEVIPSGTGQAVRITFSATDVRTIAIP
jgi:hypothetical protein